MLSVRRLMILRDIPEDVQQRQAHTSTLTLFVCRIQQSHNRGRGQGTAAPLMRLAGGVGGYENGWF